MAHAQRFGYFAGLRALAVCGVLAYEVLKHAPGLAFNPLVHRAAFVGLHGFEVFLVLAGFALALPALAALRAEGAASLDPGRFALERAFRLIPTYYAVLALTLMLPYAASRYGLSAFGHAPLPAAGGILAQMLFAGSNFGNDAFWALAVLVHVLVLFPLMLAVYVRKPQLFAALAVGATLASLFTPAHWLDIGALPALMLGILAADLRARAHAWERFALPVAVAAALAAFVTDPWIATLPGPRVGVGIENWNPLWAVAAFGLVVAPARLQWLRRGLSLRVLTLIGASAYSIALVAEPIAAYVVRKATPTLGLGTAAANAFLIALLTGLALWLAIDRHFADAEFRRRVFDAARVAYQLLRSTARLVPLRFDASANLDPADSTAQSLFEHAPGELAVLIKRTGSRDELNADILATKARLAERGSFAPFYADAPRVVAPARIVNVVHEVPEVPHPEEPSAGCAPQPRRSLIHLHIGPSSGAAFV
jgi:peptidoglycan/LPS O-acetylase OafA/YrhL